jgi:hypothetical protein
MKLNLELSRPQLKFDFVKNAAKISNHSFSNCQLITSEKDRLFGTGKPVGYDNRPFSANWSLDNSNNPENNDHTVFTKILHTGGLPKDGISQTGAFHM